MRREIISITGTLGSGKSSTADRLAEILGYRRFSSGDFMRNIAKRRGISLGELQEVAERDPSIDEEIDAEVRHAGVLEQIVIDSRLAFHWIPDSFKVYLELDARIAAERVFAHMQEVGRISEEAASAMETFLKLSRRRESEMHRYKQLYGVDHTDKSKFDIVIDTAQFSLPEVVEQVLTTYRTWLNT